MNFLQKSLLKEVGGPSFSVQPTGPSSDTFILLQIARQLPTDIMERVLQERFEEAAAEQQEEDC